jgi:hypothetical protein
MILSNELHSAGQRCVSRAYAGLLALDLYIFFTQ